MICSSFPLPKSGPGFSSETSTSGPYVQRHSIFDLEGILRIIQSKFLFSTNYYMYAHHIFILAHGYLHRKIQNKMLKKNPQKTIDFF